jgi:hypothetical protein
MTQLLVFALNEIVFAMLSVTGSFDIHFTAQYTVRTVLYYSYLVRRGTNVFPPSDVISL